MQEDYTPGSDADFDRLYRVSHPRILRTLIGLLRDRPAAEECAQETFLRAYRGWRRWKPDAPAEAWLHRIALNVATSHRRREGLRTLGNLVRLVGPPREPEAADGGAVSDLVVALRRMPPPQAAIVVLRHHHGYTNREIAAAMGVPESTVASRLAAAKARLRRELGEPEEADAQEFDADIVRTPASRVVKR